MPNQGLVTWLKIASDIVIVFGALTALSALPALSFLGQIFVDLAFWPVDGLQQVDAPATRLLAAITGGLSVGFGVMLYLVSARLMPRDPALARMMILAGVGSWFVVDGLASVAAGAPFNAALNLGFLLMFVLPLWRPVQVAPA